MDVKSHPLNLVFYHFGGLMPHPAIYSSLINLIGERRISSNILTSLYHRQLGTDRFVLLPPEPQPVSETLRCPAGTKVCLFLGLSAHGVLSDWHYAKLSASVPLMRWCKDGLGTEEGWALCESKQEKPSFALPRRCHPVVKTCRHRPDFILLQQS